jgi:hypothetical protein
MSESCDELKPPAWAESLLRLLLGPEDRESVSGDLLEQYRDSVRPARGALRADVWYTRQVAGFLWRSTWMWSVLLAGCVVGREWLDWWLSPTNDFYARATVSTWLAISIFTGAGVSAAWRSRSIAAGVLAGFVTGAISALVVDVVSLAQLAIWHDPHTMRMIAASGGVEEVFLLPPMVVVPGTLCALVGGLFGKLAVSVFRSHAAE